MTFDDYPGPGVDDREDGGTIAAPAPMPARGEGRRPPHNDEAELAVLAAVLLDQRALTKLAGKLDESMFYREAHRRVWRAYLALQARGMALDTLALKDQLTTTGELASVGGEEMLLSLTDAVPTAANVEYHARIVREAAHRRRVIECATDAAALAYEGKPADEIARQLTTALLPLAVDAASHQGYQRVDGFAVLEELERRMKGTAVSYTVGIDALDKETNGYRPGDLIIIGAVPKAGKSVLAHQMVLHHALAGHAGAIVSAEMRTLEAVERMLSRIARVSATAMRFGRLGDRDINKLVAAASQLGGARLWIDDAATPSFEDVRARAVALKAEHRDLSMIVVDFLQLVQYRMKGRRGDEELKELAYGLKGLAKTLEVVMIVPCQLNYKDIEKRPDKRPELQDLQGSSGPAQAADQVILLYRPAMYFEGADSILELIVPPGGVRDLPSFTAKTYWRGDFRMVANEAVDPPRPPAQPNLI